MLCFESFLVGGLSHSSAYLSSSLLNLFQEDFIISEVWKSCLCTLFYGRSDRCGEEDGTVPYNDFG